MKRTKNLIAMITALFVIVAGITGCSAKGQDSDREESEVSVNQQEVTEVDNSKEVSEQAEKSDDEAEAAKEDVVNLDDYVGRYVGDDTEISIEKNDDDYTMSVTIIRLTSFNEGTVSATKKGVKFESIDPSGKPIELLFSKEKDDSFTLRVVKTTWMYLENGDAFTNIQSSDTEAAETTSAGESDLADGYYYTNLLSSDPGYTNSYVRSIEYIDGGILIEAAFTQFDESTWDVLGELDNATYFIAVNENTQYMFGGGEEAPDYVSFSEFKSDLSGLMDSGLGLQIKIENGIATEVGVFS